MSRPLTRTRLAPLTSQMPGLILRMHAPAALSFANETRSTHSGGGLSAATFAVPLDTDDPPGPVIVVMTWCRPDLGNVWLPVIDAVRAGGCPGSSCRRPSR